MAFARLRNIQNPPLQGEVVSEGRRRGITVSGDVLKASEVSEAGIA
jgi:hypothetical protein